MSNTENTVSILTLGCRVNQYESDTLAAELKKRGISVVPFGERCCVAVVNTCTVTAESDRKSRQMIRRAAQTAKFVVVAGCYAQASPDEASMLEGVIFVCGNSGKHSLADAVADILAGTFSMPVNSVRPHNGIEAVESVLVSPMRTRSYIKIEDGCNNKCSYCIINKARGPVRSKSPETVLAEAAHLSSSGTQEIILTGIETASYGMDFGERKPAGHYLADLICNVAEIPTVGRIGLGSLDPTVMSEYFVGKISRCGKVLPHFHLSIQSGCDKTLAAMRRKYNSEMALSAIRRMRDGLPGVTFSADIIVGFPSEDDADFEATVRFCREAEFLHLHIFPYSKRAGTEAAGFENQVPEKIKSERAATLDEEARMMKRTLLESYVTSHGTASPVYVLVEKCSGAAASGHSEHFAEVKIKNCKADIGAVVPVYLDSTDGNFCYGHTA